MELVVKTCTKHIEIHAYSILGGGSPNKCSIIKSVSSKFYFYVLKDYGLWHSCVWFKE